MTVRPTAPLELSHEQPEDILQQAPGQRRAVNAIESDCERNAQRSAEFNTGHSAWYDSTRHRLHRIHPSIINRRRERKLEEKNRQEFFRHPKPSPLRFITYGPFSTYARITDSPIEYTSRAFVGDLRYPADNTTRDTPRPKMDGSNRQTGTAFQVSYDTSASCPPILFACPRDVTPMTRKEPSHPHRPAPKARRWASIPHSAATQR